MLPGHLRSNGLNLLSSQIWPQPLATMQICPSGILLERRLAMVKGLLINTDGRPPWENVQWTSLRAASKHVDSMVSIRTCKYICLHRTQYSYLGFYSSAAALPLRHYSKYWSDTPRVTKTRTIQCHIFAPQITLGSLAILWKDNNENDEVISSDSSNSTYWTQHLQPKYESRLHTSLVKLG